MIYNLSIVSCAVFDISFAGFWWWRYGFWYGCKYLCFYPPNWWKILPDCMWHFVHHMILCNASQDGLRPALVVINLAAKTCCSNITPPIGVIVWGDFHGIMIFGLPLLPICENIVCKGIIGSFWLILAWIWFTSITVQPPYTYSILSTKWICA